MKTLKVIQRYNDYSPRLIESINGKEVVVLKDKLGKEYCELYVGDIFVVEDERAAVLKYVETLENDDLTNENEDDNKDADLTNENEDESEKPKSKKTTKK